MSDQSTLKTDQSPKRRIRYKPDYAHLSHGGVTDYYRSVGLRPQPETKEQKLPIPTDRSPGLKLRRGKVCQVCRHPDRATIELAVARGLTRTAANRRWPGLGHAIFRYYRAHVSDSVKVQKQIVRKPMADNSPNDFVQETSVGRMNDLERLKTVLWEMLENSVEHGDVIGASKMSHQLHANIRLASEIAGDLERHAVQQVNNLVIAPDYLKLRTALIAALRPYPEAATAVATVFRELESESKAPTEGDGAKPLGLEYEVVEPPSKKRLAIPVQIDLGANITD